ncbi:MAG: hypothetical protein PWP23_2131 [Candidatus Sumerlaeota bacterium]|nr:hypothetical protein [Candidatus Sumerlaeota bacterium]
MKTDAMSHDTRERILQAATQLFAEFGYRGTTVAAVCRMASANIAAVNYYFGGKDALYVEAWRSAFLASINRHPPLGGVSPEAPAEARLRGWIRSLIERISDPDSCDFEIVHMELANPTGLLTNAMRESISPMEKMLAQIVGELLGKKKTPENIQLCMMSIQAQCLNPRVLGKRHQMLKQERPKAGPEPLSCDVEKIVDHVIEFSLAGIAAIANRKSPATPRRKGK